MNSITDQLISEIERRGATKEEAKAITEILVPVLDSHLKTRGLVDCNKLHHAIGATVLTVKKFGYTPGTLGIIQEGIDEILKGK